jgi:hypothetical protein
VAALTLLSMVGFACATGPAAEGDAETGTSSGDGDGDGDVCEGFDDAYAAPPEQIVVHNARAEPVYLVTLSDCTFNYVHLTGAAGHWPAGSCEPTCAQTLAGNCACPESCAAPVLLRIEAGGDYPLDWNYVLAADELPMVCGSDDLCPAGACVRAIPPADGDYEASVQVLLTPDLCAGPDDPCACAADEDWCMTAVFLEAPGDVEATATFSLPAPGPHILIVD